MQAFYSALRLEGATAAVILENTRADSKKRPSAG